jgi:hypothetical protein
MNIYYQDYYTDEGINANNPKEADLEFALELFYELTDEEGSFFGITDTNNTKCIQFIFVEQDDWIVDIPDMDKEGSYQKHADYDACVHLIEKFYNGEAIDTSGFIFQAFESE